MSVDTEIDAARESGGVKSLSHSAAKIGKLSTIYTLGSIAPQVITLLLLPIFTRYLEPSEMGIVTLALRVAGPLGIFVQLGLWSGLKMQYFRMEEGERESLLRTVLVGQTLQGVIVCLVLSLTGIWLAEPLLPNLPLSWPYVYGLWLMVVWSCLFTALIQLGTGLAQLLEQAGVSVGITFLHYAVHSIVGVFAVVALGWQGFGRQGTIFLASVVAGAVSFQVVWRQSRGAFDWSMFRRASMLGLTFVPHQFSAFLALAVNAWLVTKFESTGALAIYGMAISFVSLIDMPLFAFNNAAYPTLANLMREGSAAAMRHQSRLYTLQIIGVVALSLGVSLFAPTAIEVLTDARYHSATSLVPILVMGWLFRGLYLVVSQPVFFFGGGLWLASATVCSTVVCIALGILLIPTQDIFGAAWAMVGNMLVAFLVTVWAVHRLYRLPWEISKILRAIGCGVLLAVVDLELSPGLSLVLAVSLKVLLGAAFAVLLWLSGAVSTAELARGREIVARKLAAWVERPAKSC